MKEKEFGEEEIINALKHAEQLLHLHQQVQSLSSQLNYLRHQTTLESQKLSEIKSQLGEARQTLDNCQTKLNSLNLTIINRKNNLLQMETSINKLRNGEGFKEIKEIVKREVNSILNNKRENLILAVVAVFEALRKDPNKDYLLTYSGLYLSKFYSGLVGDYYAGEIGVDEEKNYNG